MSDSLFPDSAADKGVSVYNPTWEAGRKPEPKSGPKPQPKPDRRQKANFASTDSPRSSIMGGESTLDALREIENSEFAASDFFKGPQRAMPSGRTATPWYQKTAIFAWIVVTTLWTFVARIALGMRWGFGAWLRRHPGAMVRAAEVLLWPVFFVGVSWYSNAANPFYVNEGFPWPWLGVWLIALRYGALAGSVAALILLAAWYLIAPAGGFPRLYFLGGTIVTLICGEFGSLWGERSTRFKEATTYLDDKIERLTRQLYLLKLSHDELEYELVDRPGTLRDALVELRALLDANDDIRSKLPCAKAMMEFLAQYCHIEAGGLYEYLDGPRPAIRKVTTLGEVRTPDASDPMLVRAVETGQSVHLQEALVDQSRQSPLLLVAPVRDAQNNTIGVLTVDRLPFTALNPDNLRNIWVLLQAYAEYLRLSSMSRDHALDWPQAPVALRHEFAWLQRLHLDYGLQSWCVLWRCDDAQAQAVLEHIRMQHASGEMAWLVQHEGHVMLACLLPFAGIAKVKFQQQRIEESIARSFGSQLAVGAVSAEDIWLGRADAWTMLYSRFQAGVEQDQSMFDMDVHA
jgi:polysaccharide biosynthesis protein PelD